MTAANVLRRFVNTTSIKGVSKVINSPTKIQKMLWAMGALFGIAFGSWVLCSLFISFFSYSTVVSIEETLEGSPFPDVTVCNLNPLPQDEAMSGINITMEEYLSKVQAEARRTRMSMMYYLALYSQGGYLQNVNENERIEDHTHFVIKCNWKSTDGAQIPCKLNHGYFLQRGTTDFHTCVTFHTDYVNPHSKHTVYGLGVIFYLNDFSDTLLHDTDVDIHASNGRGVRVLLHPPSTLPLITREGMNIPPGSETTVNFVTTKRTWMNEPFGQCTEKMFLDDVSKRYAYSKKTCAEYLEQENVIKECQCLFPNLMSITEQRQRYPYCGKLLDNITQTVDRLGCSLDAYSKFNALFKINDFCQMPCTEYRYDAETYALPWPHEAYQIAYYKRYINTTKMKDKFKIYEHISQEMKRDRKSAFQRLRNTDLLQRNFMQLNVMTKSPELMREVHEKPAMTVFSLIGTLGGACNLWMGISFLTAIELLDLLYQLCTQCRKNKTFKEEDVNMT